MIVFQSFYEDGSGGDEESSSEKLFPQEQLAGIIGDENIHHCPTLIHLVITDSAYTEEPTNNITNTEGT